MVFKSQYWPAAAPDKLVNALLFNISWLAIVMTHASLPALAITLFYLWAHMRLMGNGRGELVLIAAVTAFGAMVDQLLFRTGVFNLAGQPALAPLWMTCLWPVFATTLMHAFAGFQNKWVLAVVCGAVGGALSYIAGVRLTDIEFGSALWGPVTLAVLWAAVLPLLLALSARLSSPPDTLQAWTPEERRTAH